MLLPSTITARRTRRYTSTLYIHRTIHGVGYNPYGWRQTVQFTTAVCQRLPARTGQFTSAAYRADRAAISLFYAAGIRQADALT